MTDEELIKSAQHGDERAFTELVRKYESRVAATVVGMLGPGPGAEDVGQEVFIRFYKNMHRFKGESGLGTYLTKIAMNCSLNEIKRRKRRRMLFWEKPVEEHVELKDESTTSDYNGNRELIEKALHQLAPDFRSVLVLRLIDGYSTKETAGILNIPTGTVLSRLARAQQKLKTLLNPYFGADYGRKNRKTATQVV